MCIRDSYLGLSCKIWSFWGKKVCHSVERVMCFQEYGEMSEKIAEEL